MRILTADAMREVDRRAIDEIGVPGAVLMENAAAGVVEAIGREYPQATSALILCGPGNNGGDGLALARQLDARGYLATPVLIAGGRQLGGDAASQLEICRRLGLPLRQLAPEEDPAALGELARGHDLVVDALFGTGLTRALEGVFARVVAWMNELPLPRVAVDLPSGLDASLAQPPGPHVHADLTVAFAAVKIAHVFPPAALGAGRVVVADLGIPRALVEAASGDLRLLEAEELRAALPPRARDSHKGSYGHLLVFAGSEGKTGAAVLTARAAVRSGAGLVTTAVPAGVLPAIEAAALESMTVAVPETSGSLAGDEAVQAVLRAAADKSALAVGPGLGRAAETPETIRRVVLETTIPLVLDADGVNAFAGQAERLAERGGETVLTPHPMELARLLGAGKDEILADRPDAARRAARVTGSVVVLKGHLTLVADPRGGVAVNPTGNPGMATGGTGDVLTGIVGGLLAQGLDPVLAAQLAVYVHGWAGDLAAADVGETSLAAGDLLAMLPRAFVRLTDA